MKISSVGIAVFAIILICSPLNAEELTNAEIAARDFSYQGVRIGTTLKDFKRRFPKAKLIESNKPSMTSEYLTVSGGLAKSIRATFFRERIYNISIIIPSSKLSEIGGRSVLDEKFMDTFGKPDSDEEDTRIWLFPRVQRSVLYAYAVRRCWIIVGNTNIKEQLTAIKAKKLHLEF